MASEWQVKVKSDNFDRLLAENRQYAGKVLRQTGRNAVDYVKEGEPEKTGFLTNSTEGEEGTLVFYIKIGAYYWKFLNNGTRYIAPMYFVENGVNRAIRELHERLEAYWKRKS
jgi:hypothetical protein